MSAPALTAATLIARADWLAGQQRGRVVADAIRQHLQILTLTGTSLAEATHPGEDAADAYLEHEAAIAALEALAFALAGGGGE